MIATVTAPTKNARVDAIFTDVHDALCRIIAKHHVTYDEYRETVNWLTAAGAQAHEIPLLFDVFLATAVDNENFAGHGGTECNIEGPFYVPDAPRLELPYVLPKRAEDGETLRFSGTVRCSDGSPLAGALVDVWQANGNKEYSFVHPGVPEYNLRGRFPATARGASSSKRSYRLRTRSRTPGRPGSCWRRLAGCRGVPLTSTSKSRTRTLRR